MIKTFEKKEEAKLEEGNIKTIDNEQEVEDITVAVNTEVPDEVAKIEKDDKQAFEEFKEMYKGVIDIKCRQDFGDCEDEKLWEDTAKELFLQSKNYILVGDEYKAKEDLDDHLEKVEESKEIINEEKELITEAIAEGNAIFELKFDCSNEELFGIGEELNTTIGAIIAEIAEKVKSGKDEGPIMDLNGNKIGSYGIGYEGVVSALDEEKEIKTEARENDVEARINQVKEWKQKVEDAVEATDLEEIVTDILEFAEDIKDNNFAGEDLYSGMSSVLDNGDAEARGPVTYVRSVKRDMQNILDDFIDNYEQAFDEESLEEAKVGNNEFTDEDEAAYYRNKELYAHSCLARHREAMEKAKEACISKGIKLDEEVCSKQLEETKTFSEEAIEKTIKEYLAKTNGIFTDDSIYDIVEELCGESDIDKMPKDLVDQVKAKVYKDNKIEEKRKLPQAEIDQLRKNMRQVLKDHGKFDNDEELEDYIEEFMPMWIEAQENLGEPVILDESKEVITEDQYEMERRKGRPNLNEIAKEVFEYDDYFIDVVDQYASEREFIIEHIADLAADYNLKEPAAWVVMQKIYKMAKEAKENKVEESFVSDYTLNQLNNVLQNAEENGLGFTLQIMSKDNDSKTKHLDIDLEDFRAMYSALEDLRK